MDGIKSILLAVIFIAFGIVYVVSPLDLLPGLPIDDIAVAITTTITSIREIKKGLLQIPTIGNLIVITFVILIATIIICSIF
jgi:hypothetical protein